MITKARLHESAIDNVIHKFAVGVYAKGISPNKLEKRIRKKMEKNTGK